MLQLLVFFVLVAVVVETFWRDDLAKLAFSTRDLLLVTFLVSIILAVITALVRNNA